MKGICFIEPLFHKVVKGQKTQTRRMIVSRTGYFQVVRNSTTKEIVDIWQTDANEWCGENLIPVKPKYKLGEVVYLKEPYAETCDEFGSPLVAYKFDNTAFYLIRKNENGDYVELNTIKKPVSTKWTINNFPACGEWKNKLFMPEWAARHFIKITGVRVEKLQNISEADCLKEGIESFTKDDRVFKYGLDGWGWTDMPRSPKEAYAALIDKINGKGTWDSNPFVWVYDFEVFN